MSITQTRHADTNLDAPLDRASVPDPSRAVPSARDAEPTPPADGRASAVVKQDATDAPEPPKLTLSPSGLAAGAMAAVTSAVVGSHLGAAGTLIGAALGSLIGAVATAIYTFSIKRTWHAMYTTRIAGRRAHAHEEATAETATQSSTSAPAETATPKRSQRSGRRVGKVALIVGVGVTAVVAFVISLAIITGIEKVGGTSLSGQPGTTVQHVQESRAAASDTSSAKQDDASDVRAVPAASSTATPQPSTSTTSPSPEASPRPSTGSEPSTTSAPSTSSSASSSQDSGSSANSSTSGGSSGNTVGI